MYTLQGLWHPARRVRQIFWRIHNMIYVGEQDSLVPFMPVLKDDERNKYGQPELMMTLWLNHNLHIQKWINNHCSFIFCLFSLTKPSVIILELFHFLARVVVKITWIFLFLKTVRLFDVRYVSCVRYAQCLKLTSFPWFDF